MFFKIKAHIFPIIYIMLLSRHKGFGKERKKKAYASIEGK
jgi:hypothetical protein